MDSISISNGVLDMHNKIADLEKEIGESRKNHSTTNDKLQFVNSQIDLLIDTLTAYVVSDGMDKDIAEELAGCFGRTLSRTVSVNFCIHGTMELTIPVDAVIGDLEDEFDILIQPSYTSEVVMEWDDIHSVEIEEA